MSARKQLEEKIEAQAKLLKSDNDNIWQNYCDLKELQRQLRELGEEK